MRKKITITLLLLSPLAILAFEFAYRPKVAPDPNLVGTWEIPNGTGAANVRFTLHEDGSVEGTVGNATMQDACLRRNRGWLGRKLGWATDYVIVGKLQDSVTDKVQCSGFGIVGRFDDQGIRGEINCFGCSEAGRKRNYFGAVNLTFARVGESRDRIECGR